ncbi:Retrovirus-related Pol polyprotein from type-1 retrotransposable element R1 2 [Eumeta japonica]|uniref:Retrovirus-related Pol polyprotein from type-1 retrotransposable element R1 2 n=1 Tax=Eumeta variegata TaxID=151549 RepID=A0A4C1UWL6_EUMVA|nr:Retrovirus-related Pol polyprotein from type-1 retrotransposable element R1 2 [Eumeta japonica]
MGDHSIRAVPAVTMLEMIINDWLSFAKNAQSIDERAAKSFGKVSRMSAMAWGMQYPSLLTVYRGTYLATVTYAADCWHMRAKLNVVRSALLKTQRPALTLSTKVYHTTNRATLPVLAGVLLADYKMTIAGKVDA